MNDTHPKIARIFQEMLMSRSGVERMMMGFSMHETARQLVIASVLNKNPNATPAEIRRALFLRFYGNDFDEETKEKILQALAATPVDGRR